MGHRGHSAFRRRPYGPDPFGREAQDRTRIAQAAAKLIAEHGISDWSLAKRKAVRQLMLPDRTSLPGDDEVEAALVDYHALFGGSAHVAQLRSQREEALRWMRRLAAFEPALVGGVAAGWATAHSDIRIDLVADDAKAVELALLNNGVAYRTLSATADEHPNFYIDTPVGGVRLSVRTAEAARQLPRRDRHGSDVLRLSTADLSAVLSDRASPPGSSP